MSVTNHSDITISKAEVNDIEPIVKIWIDIINWHSNLDESFILANNGPENFRTMLLTAINDPSQVIFVAKQENTVVGFVYGYIRRYASFFKKRNVAHISDIAVISPLRSRKIGTRLLKEFEKFALENNADEITLYVHSKNLRAINFYEKNGFKERLISMAKKLEKES